MTSTLFVARRKSVAPVTVWTLKNSGSYPFHIFGSCYSMLRARWFFFVIIPVVWKVVTHFIIVFRSGTAPWRPMFKWILNARCSFTIDSLFFTNASYAKTRRTTLHCSIVVTKWHYLKARMRPFRLSCVEKNQSIFSPVPVTHPVYNFQLLNN